MKTLLGILIIAVSHACSACLSIHTFNRMIVSQSSINIFSLEKYRSDTFDYPGECRHLLDSPFQSTLLFRCATNIMFICSGVVDRNVYQLDGGLLANLPSLVCRKPDPERLVGDRFAHPFWPKMAKYPEIAPIQYGETIGPTLSGTNQYLPARADGRYYLAGGYYFACWKPGTEMELFSSLKPGATNYLGFQTVTNGVTRYGWVRAYCDESLTIFLDSIAVVHPEADIQIQAGVEPVPTLRKSMGMNMLNLHWHLGFSNLWTLEASETLSTDAPWKPVEGAVSNRVSVAINEPQKFYRLRRRGGSE